MSAQPATPETGITVLPAPAARSLDLMPPAGTWTQMLGMAEQVYRSGLMPDAIKNAQAVATTFLKGYELGIPPMAAIEGIHIIKGKATVGAHLMLGLIKRAHGGQAIRVAKTDATACVIEYREPGWDTVARFTFTIEEARAAKLMNNPTWQSYPAAMLRARAISAVGKMAFPEVVGGLYVAGELGDAVTVTDDGEVEVVIAPPPSAQSAGKPAMPAGTPQRPAAATRTVQAAESREGKGSGKAEPKRTDAQNRQLHALASQHWGQDGHDVLHRLAAANFGVGSTNDLTAVDAKHLIGELNATDFDAEGALAWLDELTYQEDVAAEQADVEAKLDNGMTPDEIALISFREQAEASNDWEGDGLLDLANGDAAKWLLLIQLAPTIGVLTKLTGEAKRLGMWSQDVYGAYTERNQALRAKADTAGQ